MRLNKLIKNKNIKAGTWYTLTNFFLKGISFLTIPVFTRLLTTSEYGVVALYKTYAGIFMILISLSLTESIRRAKYDFTDNYNEFTSSIVFLSYIIFFCYLLLFIFIDNCFMNFSGFSKIIVYLMLFHAFFNYMQSLTITKFRFEYKYKIVSIVSIVTSISSVVISIVLIMHADLENKSLANIVGVAIPIIIIGFIFSIYLLIKGKHFIDFKYWRYALTLSLPLVIHNISNVLNNQFDRIIINKYLGNSATGIYSFAYNVGMIVCVISISLEQAWLPWFFENYKENNIQLIKKRALNYRDLFVCIYICILLVSTEIIKTMATKNYWDGFYIIPWIFMAYFFQFMYGFEVNIEFALKKTKQIPIGTVLSVIVNIVLNLIFVPIYGYIAAAITTTISYFVLFIFHRFMTSKILKIKLYDLKFHLQSIIYVISATIYFLIFQEMFFARIIGLLITILYFSTKLKRDLTSTSNI